MVLETEAIELRLMLGAGASTKSAPGSAGHARQTFVERTTAMRLKTPPLGVGDTAAVTKERGVPVLAPTDAPLAGFDGPNGTFSVIVGARESGMIRAQQQMGTQMPQPTGQFSQPMGQPRTGRERGERGVELGQPVIEQSTDSGSGHLLWRLRPTAVEERFGLEPPQLHLLNLFEGFSPSFAFLQEPPQSQESLLSWVAGCPPFFFPRSRLAARSSRA